LLSELTRSLEALQDELEPSKGGLRPPTPRQLTRFTSEVTIPALILVLETNVQALRLVQRALRLAEGRESAGTSAAAGTRERATKLGQATLQRLDSTLVDLQEALEGRPPDDEARQLLDRVRDLEDEIEAEMQTTAERTQDETTDSVEIDVDAELQSLKDDVDADEGNNTND
jgi:small-conductance mechanosensitive channel